MKGSLLWQKSSKYALKSLHEISKNKKLFWKINTYKSLFPKVETRDFIINHLLFQNNIPYVDDKS